MIITKKSMQVNRRNGGSAANIKKLTYFRNVAFEPKREEKEVSLTKWRRRGKQLKKKTRHNKETEQIYPF